MASIMQERRREHLNTPHLASASGSIASFQTDMRANLEEIKIHFNPQQASGTPSPSSPIPIYGWTGVDLNQTGNNFLKLSNDSIMYRYQGNDRYTISFTETGMVINTIANGYYWFLLRVLYITPDMVGKTFVYSSSYSFSYDAIVSCDASGGSRDVVPNGTIRSADVGKYLTVRIYPTAGVYPATYTINNMQVELSPASAYEPYVGNKIPVSWSELGAVYGGYVNEKGEVRATHGFYHITGTEVDSRWSIHTSSVTPYRVGFLHIAESWAGSPIYIGIVSDKLGSSINYEPPLYHGTINRLGNMIIGVPEELSTISAAKAWVQSIGGIDVCWELRTPQLVGTISPIQLKTLIGQNNIWSSANGNVDVKYWKH